MELFYDPERFESMKDESPTGIFIRANGTKGWQSVDIACLTKVSLIEWLRSRGDDASFAEAVVCILLGHRTED